MGNIIGLTNWNIKGTSFSNWHSLHNMFHKIFYNVGRILINNVNIASVSTWYLNCHKIRNCSFQINYTSRLLILVDAWNKNQICLFPYIVYYVSNVKIIISITSCLSNYHVLLSSSLTTSEYSLSREPLHPINRYFSWLTLISINVEFSSVIYWRTLL